MINVPVDVVQFDVPLLIGKDLLCKFRLYVNRVSYFLVSPDLDLFTPLVRKNGHFYLESRDTILFTQQELLKIHRNMSHPATDKLMNLLKLARA